MYSSHACILSPAPCTLLYGLSQLASQLRWLLLVSSDDQVPVSIADLGGTEIDLRFKSSQGNLSVVVAPVLRFSDSELPCHIPL